MPLLLKRSVKQANMLKANATDGKVKLDQKSRGQRAYYIIGTLDVLQACDACADMGMTYSVIIQCTDCVVFPKATTPR